jgi:formate dehydrogenase assembly factor FdhD
MRSAIKLCFGAAMISAVLAVPALAQDIPGIEICTAERDMVRRTSCLQSNVNFLQQQIAKEAANAKRNLEAASRQIDELKRTVSDLQKTVADLQKPPAKPEPEKVPK